MSESQRPHRGVLILVLSIAGLVMCPLIGIAPLVMGLRDLKAIDRGEIDPMGRDLTLAGMVLGILNMVLAAIYALIGALFVFAIVRART